MRRRTKRTSLRPRPFIVLGLIVNLFAGILYSPVTAVRKIRVEGAPANDEARLTRLMQSLRGVPCARVNARAIESDALDNPEIRGASLARTPFGSAVLRVARRTAVARLYAAPSIGLSSEGVLYPASELSNDLPLVELPGDYPKVGLTLGNGWRAADVARLATIVNTIPAKGPVRIRVFQGGRLCLNIDSGVVELGDYKRLDEKVKLVSDMLRKQPDFFANIQTVNIVKPEAPMYLDRKGAPKS
ncbi:hypothetical protein EON82_07660 [bacterium]|nr:MAG: hypothetical protein EON82_07660 [bacterium]